MLSSEEAKTGLLAARRRGEISQLQEATLFREVLKSIAQHLPVKQSLTLASLTHLFQPDLTEPPTVGAIAFRLNWFAQLDYHTQQNWYQLALLQQQLRQLLFSELVSSSYRANVAPWITSTTAILEVLSGVVDGDSHSVPEQVGVVLTHSTKSGELPFGEEAELNSCTLEWLGCDWSDAPVARVEAVLDRYNSRLVFYLPGLHPPTNHLIQQAQMDFLEQQAITGEVISGFERPFDEAALAEVLAELELEEDDAQ